jgi:hypothetical protein
VSEIADLIKARCAGELRRMVATIQRAERHTGHPQSQDQIVDLLMHRADELQPPISLGGDDD